MSAQTEIQDNPEYSRFAFIELVNMVECWLVITPELNARIKHPGCNFLAYVSVELDAFYCSRCRFNGRISGAWVVGTLAAERDDLERLQDVPPF